MYIPLHSRKVEISIYGPSCMREWQCAFYIHGQSWGVVGVIGKVED